MTNNENFEEMSNLLKIIAWKSISDLYDKKKEIIDQMKQSEPKMQVLNLCDGENCQEDIANKLNKDPTTIRDYLKPMFEKGIIFTKSKGNKKMIISLEKIIEIIFDSINWEL